MGTARRLYQVLVASRQGPTCSLREEMPAARISASPRSASAWRTARAPTSSTSEAMSVSKTTLTGGAAATMPPPRTRSPASNGLRRGPIMATAGIILLAAARDHELRDLTAGGGILRQPEGVQELGDDDGLGARGIPRLKSPEARAADVDDPAARRGCGQNLRTAAGRLPRAVGEHHPAELLLRSEAGLLQPGAQGATLWAEEVTQ